jgi:hypothetical protein
LPLARTFCPIFKENDICELLWYVALAASLGPHLVKHLKAERFWVSGADLKSHEYATSEADDFLIGGPAFRTFVAIWSTAVLMRRFMSWRPTGGAGFIFRRRERCRHHAQFSTININLLDVCRTSPEDFLFVLGVHLSAYNQMNSDSPNRVEIQPMVPPPTVNTGRNFSASGCTSLIRVVAG